MPERTLTGASVDAIVRHAAAELRMGAPLDHVLREAALMGALYGGGLSQQEAIRRLEAREAALLGPLGRWEIEEARQMGYHPELLRRARGRSPWGSQAYYGGMPTVVLY